MLDKCTFKLSKCKQADWVNEYRGMQVSCPKHSCVLFDARNYLYSRKKLAQESMTHAEETCASFWYNWQHILERVSLLLIWQYWLSVPLPNQLYLDQPTVAQLLRVILKDAGTTGQDDGTIIRSKWTVADYDGTVGAVVDDSHSVVHLIVLLTLGRSWSSVYGRRKKLV